MMIDWNEYHKALGARIGELAKLSPELGEAFNQSAVALIALGW